MPLVHFGCFQIYNRPRRDVFRFKCSQDDEHSDIDYIECNAICRVHRPKIEVTPKGWT